MQYTRIKYHIMGSPLRFVFSFDLDVSKWEVSIEYTKRNEVIRKDIHLKPSQMFCINEILTPKIYNGFDKRLLYVGEKSILCVGKLYRFIIWLKYM